MSCSADRYVFESKARPGFYIQTRSWGRIQWTRRLDLASSFPDWSFDELDVTNVYPRWSGIAVPRLLVLTLGRTFGEESAT